MFAFLEKDSFPGWYSMLKWGVPIGLAAISGVGTGMLLTGSIGMPAFFGMLKWGPAFYASLEGFSSIAALGVATSMIASTVGVLSAFILRGTVLFPLTETIAVNAQRSHHDAQSKFQQEKDVLEKRCDEAEKALQASDAEVRSVTTQYNLLLGAQGAKEHGRARLKTPAPTTAAPVPAANDAEKAAELAAADESAVPSVGKRASK